MTTSHVGQNYGQCPYAAESFEQDHGFTLEMVGQLAGKRLLMLGSGLNRWEDYYLSQFDDLDVRMVNIDPIYSGRSDLKECPAFTYRTGDMVAGVGQHLPFRDARFDAVFSTWSMPQIFNEDCPPEVAREQTGIVAKELARVLTPEGTISLAPVDKFGATKAVRRGHQQVAQESFEAAGFETKLTTYIVRNNGDFGAVTRLTGIKTGGV